MATIDADELQHQHALKLNYRAIAILGETIFYGVNATLTPIAMYITLRKGLRAPVQKLILGMAVFMFCLCTAHWAVLLADLLALIRAFFLAVSPSPSTMSPLENELTLMNALGTINYALADAVVVWRAWVLCHDESSKLLVALILLLGASTLAVLLTVVIRIAMFVDPVRGLQIFQYKIEFVQEIAVGSSLVTNLLATVIIALKAWRYRRWIVRDLAGIAGKKTKAERVLALLVESGLLYIVSSLIGVTSSIVHIPGPSGIPLGNEFVPSSIQISAIYPLAVIILVSRESALDRTRMFHNLGRVTVSVDAGAPVPAHVPLEFATRVRGDDAGDSCAVAGKEPHDSDSDSDLDSDSVAVDAEVGWAV
ncbi:hypothetical protein BC834DRAFT_1036167 [Gloeopeniophorella convolvens]|nr:hypothetical protein BC834DRAFT_1036167 [Gloeopeniophorella convolvens]